MSTVASPAIFQRMIEAISTKQEVLADQGEAALGICYIVERVPVMRQLARVDLSKFRRRLERALTTVKGVIPDAIKAKPRRSGKSVLRRTPS